MLAGSVQWSVLYCRALDFYFTSIWRARAILIVTDPGASGVCLQCGQYDCSAMDDDCQARPSAEHKDTARMS